MIIKLTECRKIDGEIQRDFDIYVNMANFVTMNRSIKGRDTHIKLVNAFIFVKETPEEIIAMMEPPMMTAPEVMTQEDWEKQDGFPPGYLRYGAR